MYKAVVLLVVVLLGVFAAEAQKPNLKLPFPAGETWEVSRGYNPDGDPLHENSSHRNYGYWADDRYALDFNLQENADLGRPVLAVAPGTVISVSYDGGWGNTVIIDHGNGYRSRYSHLDSFSVKVDQLVIQGYEVGKCGTTGNSTGPHIHFALYHNGVAELPEPMSGYTGFVNGGKYISDNYGLPVGRRSDGTISQQIVDAFDDNGGIGSMGSPLSRYIDGQSRPQTVWQWGTCEIQVFDNGTLGECAIVYDLNANYALAYVLHGRLWQYFKANHGPWMNVVNGSTINSLGGPIDRERFAFDLASGQTLSVQKMAYGWLVFNAATGQSCALGNDSTFRVDYPDYGDTGVGGGSDVGIAIVPGDGQTLSLWVQAQSPTSVYLTNNAITGAAEYWYYRNGQFLGYDANLEYLDNGLVPNTSYTYQAVAVDSAGNVLAQSDEVSVTTLPTETLPSLTVTLQPRSSSLEVSCSSLPGVSYYSVKLNGSFYNTYANSYFTIYGVSSGSTYRVEVTAYSGDGQVLGTGSKSIKIGQTVGIYATNYPAVIQPGQTYTVDFWLNNETPDPIYNFDARWCVLQSSVPDWLTVDASSFPTPSSVSPYSVIHLCTAQFSTASFYPLASKAAVACAVYADCPMPSQSVLSLSRTVQAVMAVTPFADLALTLQPASDEWDSTEMISVTVSVENRSNATCPSARLEGYVDGQLTVSVLIPKLLAREFWQVDLPIGFHSGGSHEVLMKVDATDEITEVDETNNSDSLTFVVLVRDPEVTIDQYPRWGQSVGDGYISGQTVNLDNPLNYQVGVYIKVWGVVFPKPNVDSLMSIQSDGSWRAWAFTHPNDANASEIRCYVVPKGTNLPDCYPQLCLEFPDIPQAVAQATVKRDLGLNPRAVILTKPVKGGSSWLKGKVYDINYNFFEVMTYIKVWGVWFPKPNVDSLMPIQSDGSWWTWTMTHTNDWNYSEIRCYVVPKGTNPPDCYPQLQLQVPTIPEAVAVAVAKR